MKINQIIYILVGLSIFVVLKLLFKYSNSDDLNILLRPTNYLFSLMQNSEWEYTLGNGYYYPEFNIVINKSCSGGNFFLICFLTFLFTCINLIRTFKSIVIYISMLLVASFVIAIFSNVSRILILLKLNHLGFAEEGLSHEAVGGFIYLVLLIISFLIFNAMVVRKKVESSLEDEFQPTSNFIIIH